MRTGTFIQAFKKSVILVMAMMVLSFSLGSLINFHLNRIYGNPLATDLIFVKKDEKVIKAVKAPVVSSFTGFITENITCPEPAVITTQGDVHHFSEGMPVKCTPLNNLLRAPPVF